MGRSRSPISLDDRQPARFQSAAPIVCRFCRWVLPWRGDTPAGPPPATACIDRVPGRTRTLNKVDRPPSCRDRSR